MNNSSAEKALMDVLDYVRSLEREIETLKRMNTTLQEKIIMLEKGKEG